MRGKVAAQNEKEIEYKNRLIRTSREKTAVLKHVEIQQKEVTSPVTSVCLYWQ